MKDEVKFNCWTNVYGKCVLYSFMGHKTKVIDHLVAEHQPFWYKNNSMYDYFVILNPLTDDVPEHLPLKNANL